MTVTLQPWNKKGRSDGKNAFEQTRVLPTEATGLWDDGAAGLISEATGLSDDQYSASPVSKIFQLSLLQSFLL